MKERGMIFSASMIRAILAGKKSQTRRWVKPQPEPISAFDGKYGFRRPLIPKGYDAVGIEHAGTSIVNCPYGQPGDRLWVRETWRATGTGQLLDDDGVLRDRPNSREQCVYAADEVADAGPWRPSILMPRWASRITLEVKAVRVERLQNISFADCRAEGCNPNYEEQVPPCTRCDGGDPCNGRHLGEKWPYTRLWESINGEGSWAANPWVWVIEFERVKP